MVASLLTANGKSVTSDPVAQLVGLCGQLCPIVCNSSGTLPVKLWNRSHQSAVEPEQFPTSLASSPWLPKPMPRGTAACATKSGTPFPFLGVVPPINWSFEESLAASKASIPVRYGSQVAETVASVRPQAANCWPHESLESQSPTGIVSPPRPSPKRI